MTDNFALLGQPRQPWLDGESLKARFIELSTAVHPDRVHQEAEATRKDSGDQFALLNAAYQCLREPKGRLKHLLELETGAPPRQVDEIPEDFMKLFMEMGLACRETDALMAERKSTASPLLKVQLFARGEYCMERLRVLQMRVRDWQENLEGELKEFNAAWKSAPAEPAPARRQALPLRRLEELYRSFGYLTRWSQQIQERLVQLTF